MPECPVCRREFDARFQVFAPGGHEPLDTLECARRAARTADADKVLAPLILPTIELLPIARPPAVAGLALLGATRRRLAAAVAVPLVASPTAIAAGLSLVAAGTATSLYLWSPALDKVGQVVAAPALPLQPSGQGGDTTEGHAPPSFSPVTGAAFNPLAGGAEEEGNAAGVVASAEAGVADEVAKANSGATEDAPTVTAAAASSPIEPEDPPAASDGRPVSPGEASPPHPRPPLAPAGPKSHPSAPPPTTTAPPAAAGGSPSPPPPPAGASSPPRAPVPRSVPGSPTAVTEEPSAGKKPTPKPKDKKGATPAVPADGKQRRDEPKPRPSPAAIPAVPASEQETSEAGGHGSADSVASGGSQGTTGEERGNGNGQANGNGNGNGNGKKP